METPENTSSNSENQEYTQIQPAPPKRDLWLTVLLCFSLANGVIMSLSDLSMFALYDLMKELFVAENIPERFRFMLDQINLVLSTNRFYFLLVAVAYAVSFTGAIFMWNLRKIGFHLYVVAQLAALALSALFLGVQNVSMGELMLTILFVISYAMRLKLFR